MSGARGTTGVESGDGGTLTDTSALEDDPIVKEAQERFLYCEMWEEGAQKRWQDDYKFAVADPENGYQWPNDIRRQRDIDERPCLTINRTRQHNLMVINNLRRAAPNIKYKGAGGGATKESAEIWTDLARAVQNKSGYKDVYGMAIEYQVKAGMGYWLVTTDYARENSFDQEIFLEAVPDPLGVYMDPDMEQRDGSDCGYGFIFKNIKTESFERHYPKWKHLAGKAALGNGSGWLDEDHVRIARYYVRDEIDDELVGYFAEDGSGWTTALRSKVGEKAFEKLVALPKSKTRELVSHRVQVHTIVGTTVIETKDWPGKYIPIVRLPGEEHVIDGIMDRVGHTRALKDAQRMYNYWTSSAVEHIALQSKVPWIVPAEAIEGYEDYWATANTENYSYLPYNHRDDLGEIPQPQRLPPPVMPQAYIQGMQVAQTEMMLVSGQHEAEFGQQTPERSGTAIQQRQEQSDNATYHFMENLCRAIRFTGMIILDLAPKIYDTQRLKQIVAENGASYDITIDPAQMKAYNEHKKFLSGVIDKVFNPNVGEHDVEADAGPDFGTRREAAQQALLQLMTQAPQLTPIIADLMIDASDWPMSDEAAERLRRMVPPQALGAPPPKEIQMLQTQLQAVTKQLQEAHAELLKNKVQKENRDKETLVDAYKAETDRMAVTHEQIGNANELEQTMQLESAKIAASLAPPQQAPAAPPQLDPNNVLAAQQQQAQNAHDAQLAQGQAAHEAAQNHLDRQHAVRLAAMKPTPQPGGQNG